jgi:hypothetical protein
MISFKQKGDFVATIKYLTKNSNLKSKYNSIFKKYGDLAIERLEKYTPKKTGLTSRSWSYDIEYKKDTVSLNFSNSNIQNGLNVAILIQFGHGTASGKWVNGRDYLNPALVPIMDWISDELWKEVTSE